MANRSLVLCFALVSGIVGALFSCSSDTPLRKLAQPCSINSDCDSRLVCVFQRCHTACTESRDCPLGERCAASVCQLPEEITCSGSSPCQSGQVCGTDQQCRAQCTTSADCAPNDVCLVELDPSACYAGAVPGDQAIIVAESKNAGSSEGGESGASSAPPDASAGGDSSVTPGECKDKLTDGKETDIDCGGNCSPCAIGKACVVASDCASLGCVGKKCRECAPGTTECSGQKQSTCNNGLWVIDNDDCASGCDPQTGACRICAPSTCESVKVIFHGATASKADVELAVDDPKVPKILSVNPDAGADGALIGQKTVLFGNFTADKTQYVTDNTACQLPKFELQTNIYYLAQDAGLGVKSTLYPSADGGSVDFQSTQYCQACPNFGCDNYISTPARIDEIEIQADSGDLTCEVCLYRTDGSLIRCVPPNTKLSGDDLTSTMAPALLKLDDGKSCGSY